MAKIAWTCQIDFEVDASRACPQPARSELAGPPKTRPRNLSTFRAGFHTTSASQRIHANLVVVASCNIHQRATRIAFPTENELVSIRRQAIGSFTILPSNHCSIQSPVVPQPCPFDLSSFQ